jgi:pilus assembly protein CpaC
MAAAMPWLSAQTAPVASTSSTTATSAALSAASSTGDTANDLYVSIGKTVLIDCAYPVSRVAVALGEVAEATVVSPTEVMINGKQDGETSLILWDSRGGRQFFSVIVRPNAMAESGNAAALRRELGTDLPGQALNVSVENGNVILRGTVKDLTSSDRAVKIAGTMGKVVNLLDVKVPASDPQILLKVRFASVDRSLEKQLGINLFSTGFGNVLGGVSTGQFLPPTVNAAGAGFGTTGKASVANDLNLLAFLPGLNIGATIEALESKGVIELLAEPNVLAANGKQASFLAGGEYPYPVVQGSSTGGSTVTIQFKEYGIRLNFLPTITPRGTIRLQVAPEVSSLDYINEIDISGFEVPGITTRKVNTEVELSDRQSFVIGGLLDNSETENFQKIPFLGDIPILGKFFQSTTRTKNNTELIVLVTPEIVAPIPAGAEPPSLNYPATFLPANSDIPMNTPDSKPAAKTAAPASMPVEKLEESLRPETPLAIGTATGNFAGSTSTAASGRATPRP